MIDLESPLFTELAKSLREAYPGIYVTPMYVPVLGRFPAVSIIEADNATYLPTWSNRTMEQYAQVMYEISVYSNLKEGKKSQARAIMNTVDELLQQYGFERMMCQAVQNYSDPTIYRMVGRYRAIVSDNLMIYRR